MIVEVQHFTVGSFTQLLIELGTDRTRKEVHGSVGEGELSSAGVVASESTDIQRAYGGYGGRSIGCPQSWCGSDSVAGIAKSCACS